MPKKKHKKYSFLAEQKRLKNQERENLLDPFKKVYLMGDIGQKCYEKYGRGILFNMPGSAPKYVLPDCSWLNSSEIENIEKYNPNTEVIIAEFIAPKSAKTPTLTTTFLISEANQLKVKSSCQTIDELVSKLFVACKANEPS